MFGFHEGGRKFIQGNEKQKTRTNMLGSAHEMLVMLTITDPLAARNPACQVHASLGEEVNGRQTNAALPTSRGACTSHLEDRQMAEPEIGW
jgi:hypothetical protein